LYQVPYPAFIGRPVALNKLVRNQQYDVIVSMDVGAAWHAALAAIAAGTPIIQIIAGGPVPRFPIIHLPGIIVFSQELYDGIPLVQGIPQDYLVLSAGRIDFSYFENVVIVNGYRDFGFTKNISSVLLVSRMHFGKHEAIQALFEQIKEVARLREIQLVVVGEGDARSILEAQAAQIVEQSKGRARIIFMGGFRITPSDLRQADLVIGQGRTVVEALASGVPAGVCGSSGYFGLLTPTSLPILVKTNLTGRGIQNQATLLEDLERLDFHKAHEFDEVHRMAFDIYDVSHGARTIELIVESIFEEPSSFSTRCMKNMLGYIKTGTRVITWGFDKIYRELIISRRQ